MTVSINGLRVAAMAVLLWLGHAWSPAQASEPAKPAAEPAAFLAAMAGEWTVRQRMWPASGAAAVELPAAVATRRLVGGAFLEETMTPLAADAGGFTRTALVVYNAVVQQYEYVSIDTRAPQVMAYIAPGANRVGKDMVHLTGSTFTAPQWGEARNVGFRYRAELGPVLDGRQEFRLFLTPLAAGAKEFLAFEYVYTRRN